MTNVADQRKTYATTRAFDSGEIVFNEGDPGDRLRLDRIITNLVDNAIKFVPPGGSVTVIAEKEKDGVRVAINNTGLGIPPDQRDRMFERFVQTDEGRKASGFGLGLAYCRSAITAHGGRIWTEEGDNDIGTKMIFTLPVKQR